MTFKKASKKRQFPKHKDRKQNNKKKELGKIRLKTTEKNRVQNDNTFKISNAIQPLRTDNRTKPVPYSKIS